VTRWTPSRVRLSTRIVQSLRGLARTSAPELEAANLSDLIEMSLDMIRGRLKRRGITVEQDYGPLPKLHCVPTQISQVLLNLLVNALQAIEATGRPDGLIRIHARPAGAELLLEITDNGCGIAPEHLPRIFDPFFTTKPVGEGMGLGLAITHSIVTGHGGRIDVESRPGAGTTVRIHLPIHPKRGPA
jgi:signal transduction histidine kinase